MSWFKKSAPQPAPVSAPAGSLFTTDASYDRDPLAVRAIAAQSSFQQRPTFAMDDSLKDVYSLSAQNVPDSQVAWYASQGFIGYQMCALLAQHWLIEKACWMPPKDAVRKGYEITVNDGTDLDPMLRDRIRQLDKRMGLHKFMIEYAAMARVFGIRIAMFKVDSPDSNYYKNPFNIDGVRPGAYRGIVQIDPYWTSPMLDRDASSVPDSAHFYEPTWWMINGRPVHRSHLVIYRINEVADVLKPSYLYGGISLPQRIYERVYAAERTANEAPQLAMTKRLDVLYTDTAKALAHQGKFEAMLAQWRAWMDNYGVKVADAKGDKIERLDTSLAELDAVIMTQYQLVAAVAAIPATKLLGTVPKGFNSTGEYEEASYHEELENIQAHGLTPLLERHHLLLCKSEQLDVATTVAWNELDTMTALEQAQVNKTAAEAGLALVQAGAIDGLDERARVTADPKSGYTGLPVPSDEHEPSAPVGAAQNENTPPAAH